MQIASRAGTIAGIMKIAGSNRVNVKSFSDGDYRPLSDLDSTLTSSDGCK